jgi:RNA polymerase sigma factor (sigma-70 family)
MTPQPAETSEYHPSLQPDPLSAVWDRQATSERYAAAVSDREKDLLQTGLEEIKRQAGKALVKRAEEIVDLVSGRSPINWDDLIAVGREALQAAVKHCASDESLTPEPYICDQIQKAMLLFVSARSGRVSRQPRHFSNNEIDQNTERVRKPFTRRKPWSEFQGEPPRSQSVQRNNCAAVEQYTPFVKAEARRLAISNGLSAEEREDLEQEAFFAILTTGHGESFTNHARWAMREYIRREAATGDDESSVDAADELQAARQIADRMLTQSRQQVDRAIARLPQKQRDVIRMIYSGNVPLPTIAKKLKISLRTVSNYHKRALNSMRETLDGSGVHSVGDIL